MSEETQETNDGTWSGLKKTIIGTLTTVIAGGGVWVSTLIFGGGDEPAEETKTEQPAAQPVINLNVQQNQENKQKTENNNGGGTVIHERIIEKPASNPQPVQPQPKKEEESW
jgi:flagellar basal body-associated protein FliL